MVVFALPVFGVTTTPIRQVPTAAPVTNFFVTVQAALADFVSRPTVAPFGTLTLNVVNNARSATFCPTVRLGEPVVVAGIVDATVVGTTVASGSPGDVVGGGFVGGGVDCELPEAGVVGVVGSGDVDPAGGEVSVATIASGFVTLGGCWLGTMLATSNGGTMKESGVNDHDSDSRLVPPDVVKVAATT